MFCENIQNNVFMCVYVCVSRCVYACVWFSVSSTGKFFTGIISFNPHKNLWRQVVTPDPS